MAFHSPIQCRYERWFTAQEAVDIWSVPDNGDWKADKAVGAAVLAGKRA